MPEDGTPLSLNDSLADALTTADDDAAVMSLADFTALIDHSYREELARQPDPNEYAKAQALADVNDRASQLMLAKVGELLRSLTGQTGHSDLEQIEGIGRASASKLKAAGVDSVEGLLRSGGTPKGRKSLHETTGIGVDVLMRWVKQADLFRVPGVGSEYAQLLEAAGVGSAPELATRNPARLATVLADTNAKKKLVRRQPSLTELGSWIISARQLPRVIQH
jgi:predicted flap endonuclease-1-like 5' DNA nuclease